MTLPLQAQRSPAKFHSQKNQTSLKRFAISLVTSVKNRKPDYVTFAQAGLAADTGLSKRAIHLTKSLP
jgi:hypothetical protein